MVILFLTSGLEPGKDGVGDYTRQMAAECIRQKHSCYLLALNDAYVSYPVESTDFVDGIPILILRLPSCMAWQERVRLAVEFRARWPIDWISLQFVCYGFNRRGVVWNMARYFKPIVAGNPLHIMFHETWIGVEKSPSVKEFIVGRIQRFYIHKLLSQLKPRLVTTSNLFYASLLQGIGIDAIETPLFGNIPVFPPETELHIPEALSRAGVCDAQGLHPGRRIGLFFGAIHPGSKVENFMGILASAPKKTGYRGCLISAGRKGHIGEAIWKKLENEYGHIIDFISLGECTPRQIATLMQIADFGLISTPWHLIGKSSSTTTMFDHGLPVIVTNDDFQPVVASARPDDPLLHRCDASLEAKLWAGFTRRPARHRVGDAVESWIGQLMKSASSEAIKGKF